MEPEGSLSPLQQPAVYPCPEPDQSIPCLPPYFLKIHFNINIPSTHGSSKWSLSLTFPPPNPVCSPPLPSTCYMLRPSYSSRYNHPNNKCCPPSRENYSAWLLIVRSFSSRVGTLLVAYMCVLIGLCCSACLEVFLLNQSSIQEVIFCV